MARLQQKKQAAVTTGLARGRHRHRWRNQKALRSV